jgi:DNA-binding protein H-NS
MKRRDLESMSIDELWIFHEKVAATLASKLTTQSRMLENRLRQLNGQSEADQPAEKSGRRPYPPVFPRFRNPDQPSQTWAGRGKQPRWLAMQLKSGKRIDDFRIEQAAA